MKNLFHKYSKQELVEIFLNHELDLSKHKRPEKIIYILNLLAHDHNDEQFITALYRNLLEREPDSEEYNRYVNLLKTNIETRESILHAFITSPEARKKNIQIIGLDNLINPNFFFKICLTVKRFYYSLVNNK
ncbi:MAG: DUF4214 domain-containing protein [Patescibacteria group bacterium]|jgi:hypothetical protein